MNDPFKNAQKQLRLVASFLKISAEQLAILSLPQRVVEVNFPVRLAGARSGQAGKVKIFKGWRSQHNNTLGPFKGGIRFHPQVSKKEVMALSMWMSWKCAVAGLPLGGGKGGVIVDPKRLSQKELERLSRAYIRAIAPLIGEKVDVPAPDVNTDSQIMDWMLDEYERVVGHPAPATFTGKSVKKGGSLGREEATGRGGLYVLLALLAKLNSKFQAPNYKQISNLNDQNPKFNRLKFEICDLGFPRPLTAAIQGFGNVGYHFARLAKQAGFKIIALSDSKGGIYSPDGLDPEKVMNHKNKTGSVINYPDTRLISNDQFLLIGADILAPAALENVITPKNASKIKAKVVLELANGPTTPEADKIFWRRKIWVVPDVLANSGGVTVSYFEWKQNLAKEKWSEEKVNQELKKMIVSAANRVWQTSQKYRVDLRLGAYILAVKRILAAKRK